MVDMSSNNLLRQIFQSELSTNKTKNITNKRIIMTPKNSIRVQNDRPINTSSNIFYQMIRYETFMCHIFHFIVDLLLCLYAPRRPRLITTNMCRRWVVSFVSLWTPSWRLCRSASRTSSAASNQTTANCLRWVTHSQHWYLGNLV